MELCVSGAENLKMSMMKGDKDVSLLENEDIVQQVDEMVKENCKFTTNGLYVKVPMFQDLLCILLLLNI